MLSNIYPLRSEVLITMPGILVNGDSDRKRKRLSDEENGVKSRKAPKPAANGESAQAQILQLEEQILGGREHYNNIVQLQTLANRFDKKPKTATLAAVSLCRVFCRLIASDALVRRKDGADADVQVAQWLKGRLQDYVQGLTTWIGSPEAVQESTALTLLMRIVKEETTQGTKRSDQAWRTPKSTFTVLVRSLLDKTDADGARQEFVDNFVEEHDDVRFYTFLAVKEVVSGVDSGSSVATNAINLLSHIEGIPESEDQLEDWYGQEPASESHQLRSLNAHRKAAQEAWLSIFRSPLTKADRKTLLAITARQILPWFTTRMELLTDFLTDSFDAGSSIALLALSGIFHLMTTHNLDYPDFYTKLYSLLDGDVMHSKHRSRFFRLLEKCLGSSHLPAAMVASFIKRLARLSLHAPPGAIVWVIPWVYNTLKSHPACTFMLHRTFHPAHAIYANHPSYLTDGMDDTFEMAQRDPMRSGAIESSLWELHTLTSHYHPNVATLAGILGEQFTKRDYQLEDFLEHSYAGLVASELGKDMKKTPVVEWEIPKRIVTAEEGGLNELGVLLQSAIAAG